LLFLSTRLLLERLQLLLKMSCVHVKPASVAGAIHAGEPVQVEPTEVGPDCLKRALRLTPHCARTHGLYCSEFVDRGEELLIGHDARHGRPTSVNDDDNYTAIGGPAQAEDTPERIAPGRVAETG
jgi:hypothetical protein